MTKKNDEKPITKSDLREELGRFTEEILLPAIENIVDIKLEEKLEQKLEEKLGPIRQRLFAIEQDIKRIEERLARLEKASSEDVSAVNSEVEKLKKRDFELENKIKILEKQRV